MPFISRDLAQGQAVGLSQASAVEISQAAGDLDATSALGIAASIAKMFFWTFGDFGTGFFGIILEALFLIMRISLLMIIIQYFPFVG